MKAHAKGHFEPRVCGAVILQEEKQSKVLWRRFIVAAEGNGK